MITHGVYNKTMDELSALHSKAMSLGAESTVIAIEDAMIRLVRCDTKPEEIQIQLEVRA